MNICAKIRITIKSLLSVSLEADESVGALQVVQEPCSIPLTDSTGSHVTVHDSANLKMFLYELPNTKFSYI